MSRTYTEKKVAACICNHTCTHTDIHMSWEKGSKGGGGSDLASAHLLVGVGPARVPEQNSTTRKSQRLYTKGCVGGDTRVT